MQEPSSPIGAGGGDWIRTRFRQFVVHAAHGREMGDADDIFATGFFTSLFAMEMILFVEREFGVTVETEDLNMENFRTIDRVTAFVAAKRAHRPSALQAGA